MKKNNLVLFLLLFCSFNTSAKAGVKYELLRNQESIIHTVKIDPKLYDISAIKASGKKGEKLSDIAKRTGAYVAINGGFFKSDKEGNIKPAFTLKAGNKIYSVSDTSHGAIGWISSKANKILFDVLEIEQSGDNKIININTTFGSSKEDWHNMKNIVTGVPLLVFNNKIVPQEKYETASKRFLNLPHARSAICLTNDSKILLAVVEQELWKDSKIVGMTIEELAEFMISQDCVHALNLDGGSSSGLYLNGEIKNKVSREEDEFATLPNERLIDDAIVAIPK